MITEIRKDSPLEWPAITAVLAKLGIGTAETGASARPAEVEAAERPGLSGKPAEIKCLKREVAEPRRANDMF